MIRRVTGVTLVEPGPKFVRLATSDGEDEGLVVLESDESRAAVSRRIGAEDLESSLARRQETLERWLSEGPTGASALIDRVAEFYESNPSNTSE